MYMAKVSTLSQNGDLIDCNQYDEYALAALYEYHIEFLHDRFWYKVSTVICAIVTICSMFWFIFSDKFYPFLLIIAIAAVCIGLYIPYDSNRKSNKVVKHNGFNVYGGKKLYVTFDWNIKDEDAEYKLFVNKGKSWITLTKSQFNSVQSLRNRLKYPELVLLVVTDKVEKQFKPDGPGRVGPYEDEIYLVRSEALAEEK